jgi:hypothetical protein
MNLLGCVNAPLGALRGRCNYLTHPETLGMHLHPFGCVGAFIPIGNAPFLTHPPNGKTGAVLDPKNAGVRCSESANSYQTIRSQRHAT